MPPCHALRGPAGAPLVVFVNGLGGVQAGWAGQVRALSDRWRVLTFDHRGLGCSAGDPGRPTMADYAADVVALLDAVGAGSAAVVGASFGGRVALALALDHPERVAALVLVSTAARGRLPPELASRVDDRALAAMRRMHELDERDWLDAVLPALFGPAFRERHPERLRMFARWRARHPANRAGIEAQWRAHEGFDVTNRLAEVRAPTLVMHGAADRLVPVEAGRELAARIPGARLVVFEDAGHALNVEEAPRFDAELRRFLADHLAGAAAHGPPEG